MESPCFHCPENNDHDGGVFIALHVINGCDRVVIKNMGDRGGTALYDSIMGKELLFRIERDGS